MMSTQPVHYQWKMRRCGISLAMRLHNYAESKKIKPATLHAHGCYLHGLAYRTALLRLGHSENCYCQNPNFCLHCPLQRCQSGLKSGRSWIRSTKFRFSPANFREISIFSGNVKKIQFFHANFQKFRFFHAIFKKISIFQAKIAHLQLLLGKLFYLSSKVTTFEHTFCTW